MHLLCRSLSLCLLTLLLACQSQKSEPTPPAQPVEEPASPAASIDTEPPEREPAVAPKEPATRLRLMVPGTQGLPSRDVQGRLVGVDDKELSSTLRGKTLLDVGEGVSLLIIVAGPVPKMTVHALRKLIHRLSANDRVAVGAITARGFSRVYDFSGDFSGAITAIEQIQKTRVAGRKKAPRGIQLYVGVQEALRSFRGRKALPAIRAAVLLTDGRDPSIKRSSRRQEALSAIRLHASFYQVPLHVIGFGSWGKIDGESPDKTSLGRIQTLAIQTGGTYKYMRTLGRGASTDSERVAKEIATDVHHWVVLDTDVRGLTPGRNPIVLTAGTPQKPTRYEGSIFYEHDLRRIPVVLGTPDAPPRVLPLGVQSKEEVTARARAAEKGKHWLRAGALWHLAGRTDTLSRASNDETTRVNDIVRKRGYGRGHVLRSGQKVSMDVPITHQLELLPNLVKQVGQIRHPAPLVRQRKKPAPVEKGTPNSPKGDPEIQRIILHRCVVASPSACLRSLILRGHATHLFVDPAGVVTQFVDLDRIVAQPDTNNSGASLSIHLALPADGSPMFQQPDEPLTWRHARRRVAEMRINDLNLTGWDLTAAQYQSLLPLLHGLTTISSNVRPVLPIDLARQETAQRLLHPEKFAGILNHSNLARAAGACPGPGLRLAYLNRSIPRWNRRARSLDMETWVRDLGDAARVEGAVSRFEEVGADAVPLLVEIAEEMAPAIREGALRALLAIASPKSASPLLNRLQSPIPNEGPEREVDLREKSLIASILLRTATAEHIPALAKLVGVLRKTQWAKNEGDGRETLRLLVATIAAAANTQEQLAPLTALLSDSDPELRGQAAVAWLVKGGATGSLRALSNDPDPHIRAVAAQALGAEGLPTAIALAPVLGTSATARLLGTISPKKAVPAVLDLWETAGPEGRDRLSDLIVRWKWVGAVRPLAKRLADSSDSERMLLLRTLRGVTGRDLGESIDGWLTWRPRGKQAP